MHSCSRCLLDDTVPFIQYDNNGECNYCKKHDILSEYYTKQINSNYLTSIVDKIKNDGKNKKYDCIVGISGGTDSSYILWLSKQLGLRPLAVNFDNGWASEISVSNIKKTTSKLNIDLYTYVVDWEEFKDLQISFLKAAVPCVEVPTDIAISGTLYQIAKKENVKYILNGMSYKTEGTVPLDWSFIDGTYVKNIQKQFGKKKLKSYPNFTIFDMAKYTLLYGIKTIPILNYIDYDKNEAKKILEAELNWEYYGGHHYENIYSYWAFGLYTYNKFGFDKRKVSLSGPIREGKLDKKDAIEIISIEPDVKSETTEYVKKKLGLSNEIFDNILKSKNKSFRDYNSSYKMIIKFKFLIKFLTNRGILNPVIYNKFF